MRDWERKKQPRVIISSIVEVTKISNYDDWVNLSEWYNVNKYRKWILYWGLHWILYWGQLAYGQ